MKIVIYALWLAVDAVLIGCVIHIVYVCLVKPTECAHEGIRMGTRDSLGHSFRRGYVIFVASLIGFGIFIYGGVSVLLSWMPRSWGSFDEDGEFVSLSFTIATLLAFFGSLYVLELLLKLADNFHDLDIANDSLRHSLRHITSQIDEISNSISWISRGRPNIKLDDALDKLEKKSLELQSLGSWQVRDEFKDKSQKEIFRHQLHYHIDVEPSLRLIKTIRDVIALPKSEPIPTGTVSEDDCAVCAYVPESLRPEIRKLLTSIPLKKATCEKCLTAFGTNITGQEVRDE